MASVLGSLFNRQYTIGELFNIDQGRQEKSLSCSVSLEDTFHELKKETLLDKFKKFFFGSRELINVYYVIFKFKVMSGSGSSYTVFIRTSPDFNLSSMMSNRVEIYCGCADFKYRSAYLLNQRKSLFRSTKSDTQFLEAIVNANTCFDKV